MWRKVKKVTDGMVAVMEFGIMRFDTPVREGTTSDMIVNEKLVCLPFIEIS